MKSDAWLFSMLFLVVVSGAIGQEVVLSGADGRDALGPITSGLAATPNPASINDSITVTALVDDKPTGGSLIASAWYTMDSTTGLMAASDGRLDATGELVTVTIGPVLRPDVYTLCVFGIDSAGNKGKQECILVVVYDPDGGFVTGGGAVESPERSDLQNPGVTGPATFGFVAKYLPGRTTPSGGLEFHFHAGALNFKSTSLEWLVVTGEPRAIFRGEGTINGEAVCQFEVDAWDTKGLAGKVDTFGLKIQACSLGGDRYSLPPTEISRGSVMIHTGR